MVQPPTWALSIADAVRYFRLRPWQPRLSLHGKSEPLPRRVARLRKAWVASRLADPERASEFIIEVLASAFEHSEKTELPTGAVLTALHQLGVDLAQQNDNVFEFPEVDLTRSLTAQEAHYITERLVEVQTRIEHDARIHDLFAGGLHALFTDILNALPDSAFQETPAPFTVPLHALLNPTEIVGHFLSCFLHRFVPDEPDAIAALAFQQTRTRLWQNLLQISRLSPEQLDNNAHKLVFPQTCGLPPEQMIDAYLGGTPLASFAALPLPFSLPRKALREHAAIFAPTGHGKTQTLGTIIRGLLEEDDPPGMFILTGLGAFLKEIEQQACFHPETGRLRDRLMILDPEDDVPPALNFFDLGMDRDSPTAATEADELFGYLFAALDRSFTELQASAVTYLIQLVAQIENASITTLMDIMLDPARKLENSQFLDAIEKLDPLSQRFFATQFYSKYMEGTRQQIGSRLFTLLRNPKFGAMFSAPKNRFSAFQAMQQKKIVLMNTSDKLLGRSSPVLGRFYIAQIFAAALQRPENHRPLSLLIADEFKDYADEKTERLLSQGRQFNLGMIIASQFMDQMPDIVRQAILGNTAIRMAGPVSYKDASALAREMDTSPEFIRSMRKSDRHTEFACHVRNLTPQAIQLTIPFLALEHALKMDASARERMRARNRAQVGTGCRVQQTARTNRPVDFTPVAPSPPLAPAASAGMVVDPMVVTPRTTTSVEPVQTASSNDLAVPLIKPGKDW